MFGKRSRMILAVLALVIVSIFAGQSVQADWGVSFSAGISSPGYVEYYGDRINSEYRRGYQADDWIERGSSSVTDSPLFEDGIRLTAWGARYEDDFEHALASAIYLFEIPPDARSIRIKIAYDGEADRSDLNNDIAGRVWIRRARMGDDYEEYYPGEGRYENADEPFYGDTFVLRANKRLEILRISAQDHVVDGMMELHIVAEGRQRIDVKYIEVESYTSLPNIRVITRYYKDYAWRPWYDYTYWYFYTGPVYYFSDYYYVRYIYPQYRYNYIEIRRHYGDYLSVYYVRHPHLHARWVNVIHVPKGARRTWDRGRLTRWTSDHDEVRRSYEVVSMKTRRIDEVQASRDRIRSVLTTSRRPSPSLSQTSSDRSTDAAVKTRREASISPSSPPVRTRSSTSSLRSPSSSPTRVETQSGTKERSDEQRTPVRTRSSTSIRSDQERTVRQSPATPPEQSKTTSDVERTKIRRESTRTPENKDSSILRRAPVRSSEQQKQAPPQQEVKTKKDDDDDEDKEEEAKKKSRSTSIRRDSSSSSESSSSSSTTKRRGR